MINSNALESSNENSLIVQNIIDTRSEHSVAQAQPLRSNSLLGLLSYCVKEDFYTYSPKPPTRYRHYSLIRTTLITRTTKNANVATNASLSEVLFHLLTCAVKRDHIGLHVCFHARFNAIILSSFFRESFNTITIKILNNK